MRANGNEENCTKTFRPSTGPCIKEEQLKVICLQIPLQKQKK